MKPEDRSISFGGILLAYLPIVLAAAAVLGVIRGVVLFARGAIPLHAVALAIGFNTLTALGPGLVLAPLAVLVCFLLRRLRPGAPRIVEILIGVAAVFIPFWALHTTALDGPFLRGGLWGLARHLAAWLPVLLAAGAVAVWVGTGRSLPAMWRRAGWCLAGFAAVILPLHIYTLARNPSAIPPLERAASAVHQPPVFVILVDTLRADHLSVYGYRHLTSPNIDGFAADGARFSRAFAQAPWTRPSVAALLTGRYPPDVGMRSLRNPVPSDVAILPQLFQAEGYETAGIISSIQISREFGFDKGFDSMDNGTSYLRWVGSRRALVRLGLMPPGNWYPRYDAAELTDEAIDWIESQRSRDTPMFMYLHYSDPHEPYRPPADADRWREFASERARALVEPPSLSPKKEQVFNEAEIDAVVARYDAEVAYADREIGRLLDYLRTASLYDDALIVLTSDHGEEFEEHGLWTHAKTLYNEVLHIPLIVKYPQRLSDENGRVVDAPAALVDIAPTISDVLGADWSDLAMRGRSLLALAEPSPQRVIYADNQDPALRALIDDEVKFVQVLGESGEVLDERLYSLREDFPERRPGPASGLARARLEDMRRFAASVYTQHVGEEIELDEETRRELEALGYIAE